MNARGLVRAVLLAAACLAGGGCARLLTTALAPQQAAVSTAQQVAGTAAAPAGRELAGLGREVDRLLAGKRGDGDELQRIRAEIERRMRERGPAGAAQDDPERLRPWHPRRGEAPAQPFLRPVSDEFTLAQAEAMRGLAPSGRLPDGVPAAALPSPIDLTPVRLPQRR